MSTIYVYDNELLGDDGTDFNGALIESKTCASDAECVAWFSEKYNINDYSSSFTAPQ